MGEERRLKERLRGEGSLSRLLRIISMCRAVEQRGINPFEVDVKGSLEILRKSMPSLENLEELCLDAEALNRLATIVKLQGDWLKHRSSNLFVDPLLVELKLRSLDAKRLFQIFLRAWHPILELEQLSPQRIKEAIEYWNRLKPLKERLHRLPRPPVQGLESLGFSDMLRLGLLSETAFEEVLRSLWRELLERSGKAGRLGYWEFVDAESYDETVLRAYLTSFLITYGFAQLEMDPLKEEFFLIPKEELQAKAGFPKGASFSVPISISYEKWLSFHRSEALKNG
ncbi:MAG: hypothetical protein QW220_04395 [Candidatus Bathyarchaeia archaeon]